MAGDDPTPERTATLARELQPTERVGLTPGAMLGKYTLERVLGAGGMGIVWAARDPDLERSVAIKLLHHAQASPEQRQRLLREARAMARLKHPNVLTVYEVDSDGDRDYIAMELVEGATMDVWLMAKPPTAEVWAAVLAAGRGLAAAHAAGLVHRDFKPHNVLRGRDGRVLVTDFGLARGTNELHEVVAPAIPKADVPLAETLAAHHSDQILDSTLTQPGSLIGTPAYMAPEQFTGTAPDPRTDQFAFCITAWQAFTGSRPFAGQSIDELRKSAAAGVANVEAKLPRALRAVLVRGLAVLPEERWPDMDALLDALVRAEATPRRRRALIIPMLAFGAAGVLFVTTRHDTAPAVIANANGCAPSDTAFDVWNAPRRDAFMKRLQDHPNALAVAAAFDGFRAAWISRYKAACAATPSPKITARINCLLGERDDVDGLARLTDSIPTSAIAGVELWGLLPVLEACDGDSPIAPPLLPEDRKDRDAIIRVRAELAALRMDPEALVAKHDAMIAHARTLGWKPLIPEIEVASAAASQVLGDYELARTRFEAAADEAVRLADYKLEATARIGLLEIELDAMADPTDRTHVERLIAQAADAVQRAGGDPALTTTVDNLVATKLVAQGNFREGIAKYDVARKKLIAAQAFRSAGVSAVQEIRALERRNEPDDLKLAWQVGHETDNAIDASGRTVPRNRTAMLDLEWLRGDLDEIHARADKADVAEAPKGTPITGRVVNADGTPAAGATVVAWTGRLDGDITRVYTAHDFTGTIARAASDGSFTIEVPPNALLIAQGASGPQRSIPISAVGSPTLHLEKMRIVTGTVRSDLTTWKAQGLDAFARYRFGDNEWRVRAIVTDDGTFSLAGLISAPGELGVEGIVPWHQAKAVIGGPITDRATLRWPVGPELDVIVRKAGDAITIVDVLRGHAIPKTQAELARRRDRERDVATVRAEPVGIVNATREGAVGYQRGDQHAVVIDNDRGDVTVCREASAPEAVPTCEIVALDIQPVMVALPH